jgi:hypothetical protein
MAEITKPTDLNKIWASSGAVVVPDDAKIATGWIVEAPPHQTENWINRKHDLALGYINQHGIMQWDATTEYFANKSWVQGSNGYIYKAKTNNTNINPLTDSLETDWVLILRGSGVLHIDSTTSWSRTFLQAGNSPTTARSILGISSVGSNMITQVTQASMRAALGVGGLGDSLFTSTTQGQAQGILGIGPASDGSQGLVQRATDAEAISGVDDTKFLTPKKLKLGFSINLNTQGHIIFPSWLGGIRFLWGNQFVNSNSSTAVSMSTNFPNACLNVQATWNQGGVFDAFAPRVTVSGGTFTIQNSNNVADAARWLAIGY